MISISLCMIVKNEEKVLDGCLASVKEICDEIIIVDTGSTDQTKTIALKYTDKIYDFEWIDNFSAARNFAFSHATMDYILWLDADDIVYEADQHKLKQLKKTLDSNIDSVSMYYITAYDEYDKPAFYYRRNRLVKRSNGFQWIGAVHEYLEVSGFIKESDISVVHRKKEKNSSQSKSDRNIKIYEKRLAKREAFSSRDLFYYANELKDHQQYEQAMRYYKLFLNNKNGWFEDKVRACIYMADLYRETNKKEEELTYLLKTFEFDVPSPEACCKLGDYFTSENNDALAVYWYEKALQNKNYKRQSFHYEAYSTWYPHLSLCVAYWKLGKKAKSFEHHKFVKEMRPDDPQIIYNEQFFN